MSTREPHPIDDHFRRSLAGAEVEPPAHVWAGVAAAQRSSGSRRGLPLWPLLVLLGVGAAGTFHFLERGEGQVEISEAAHAPTNTDARGPRTSMETPAWEAMATNEQAVVASTVLATTDGSHAASPRHAEEQDPGSASSTVPTASAVASPANGAPVQGGDTPGAAATVRGPEASRAQPLKGSSPHAADAANQHTEPSSNKEVGPYTSGTPAMASAPEASTAWAEGQKMRPSWMHLLPPAVLFVDQAPALRSATLIAAPYVLPRGEWWVGPSVGVIGSKLRWRGDDMELADAIAAVTGARNDLAVGASFGRTWRSGWGLSSGVVWQQGEQSSWLIDRRTMVEQAIVPRVVSLDAVVIFSTTDTLTTTTTTETEFVGVARSTVLRIPVQAHWHGTYGRLLYGAHLGLALERTSYRGGPILVRDAADGRIVPVQEGSALGQERLPLTVLGTASLDLGYQLHERWALWGGPVLMHGLAPVQRTPTVFAMPERWGLQFQLVHHLYRRSK